MHARQTSPTPTGTKSITYSGVMTLNSDAVVWRRQPAASSDTPRPLLLLMHGLGSHENDLVGLLPHLPQYFEAASLRAPKVDMGGYAWFSRGPSPGTPDPQDIEQATDAVLSWLNAEVPQNTPIIPVGFSQGGAMVTHLLRTAPEKFRAGVVLSGFRSSEPHPGDEALAQRQLPVFFGRGDADPIVTLDRFLDAEHWLETHTQLDLHIYPGLPHAVSGEELTDLSDFLLNVAPDS